MRKAKIPKPELILLLTECFRENGFEGTTLSMLTKATGLEKASLYHHFPKGKQAMAEAVLASVIDELQSQVLIKLEDDVHARDKLSSMFKAVDKFYKGGRQLCFITIFSIGDSASPIKKSLKLAVTKWVKLIESCLDELQVKDSKRRAQVAVSAIQGALIASHTLGDPKVFRNALLQIEENTLAS